MESNSLPASLQKEKDYFKEDLKRLQVIIQVELNLPSEAKDML